jgi:3-methylfumaryl-CoA hydratase
LTTCATWVGRTESAEDVVAPTKVAALVATLDRDDAWPTAGDPLPPPWHWTLCLPAARQSAIGPGRPSGARRLPAAGAPAAPPMGRRPAELPAGAAGGRARGASLARDVGRAQERTQRRPGVRHGAPRVPWPAGLCVTEEHDIVYRDLPAADAAPPACQPAPAGAAWEREIVPDDVLLFRYSALTFNGHRIHYDRRYVTEVEGYPGLIVHGPLIATLLVDLLRRNLPGRRSPPSRSAPSSRCSTSRPSSSAAGPRPTAGPSGCGPATARTTWPWTCR